MHSERAMRVAVPIPVMKPAVVLEPLEVLEQTTTLSMQMRTRSLPSSPPDLVKESIKDLKEYQLERGDNDNVEAARRYYKAGGLRSTNLERKIMLVLGGGESWESSPESAQPTTKWHTSVKWHIVRSFGMRV
jgi:hypothetical protein